jgi:hypothetical protein
MIKKATNPRKQTVTLTIGPRTLALLQLWREELGKSNPPMLWTLTDVVGVLVRKGVRETPFLLKESQGFPWVSEKL